MLISPGMTQPSRTGLSRSDTHTADLSSLPSALKHAGARLGQMGALDGILALKVLQHCHVPLLLLIIEDKVAGAFLCEALGPVAPAHSPIHAHLHLQGMMEWANAISRHVC